METESNDGSIYCLTHGCDESIVQISRRHDAHCRLCSMTTKNEPLNLVAEISYPFKSIGETTCDILLIPSRGTFADTFTNDTGLHIGIAGGYREILEFDREGIKYGPAIDAKWHRSLPLNIFRTIAETPEDESRLGLIWLNAMQQFVDSNQFTNPYEPDNNNCLDFVVSFLKLFSRLSERSMQGRNTNLKDLNNKIADKLVFCQSLVVSRTKHAARYMILKRKLDSGNLNISKGSLI